jgi:hypothetical protein
MVNLPKSLFESLFWCAPGFCPGVLFQIMINAIAYNMSGRVLLFTDDTISWQLM